MANIEIKYNDEIICTVTDEDQSILNHKLRVNGNANDTHTIEGWIKGFIKYRIQAQIENSRDRMIIDHEEKLSSEDEMIPSDRRSRALYIRGKAWYKNRDQRDSEQEVAEVEGL
jgi:hypothetical protein